MLGAVVEHFLRFFHASDAGARERAAVGEEREGLDAEWHLWNADGAKCAIEGDEVEVGVHVVGGGDAVEDEIEAAFVLRHCRGVFADDDFVGSETLGVFNFAFGGGELDDVSAEAVRKFEGHVAQTAEADDSDFFARTDAPVA